ncbi:MAG: PEP-CTERM sorting domain-containing protein [Verrucomicrobia bacterium]|nr:PEP-CTERM sorting domain-containing protein [Verrucomicrobiota bacterium]MCH8511257.1 PEP-CTERM sorting domain-containing protein [Kiritimatiellia bacterium]
MKYRIYTTLVATFCMSMVSADFVLVNWNNTDTGSAGNYALSGAVAGDYGLGDPEVDDTRNFRAFDLNGTPLSTSGSSSTWYVGYDHMQGDRTGNVNNPTRAHGPQLDLRFQYDTAGEPGIAFYLQMWKKEDFTNLSTSPAITFDENSSFSMTRSRAERNEIRWVVQEGSDFFISQVTGASLNDPNAQNWAAYNPTSDPYGLDFTKVSGDFTTRSFSDVQAVGFLMYTLDGGDQVINGRAWATLNNVQITAIPEPGTLVLLGLAGLAGLIGYRRRRT